MTGSDNLKTATDRSRSHLEEKPSADAAPAPAAPETSRFPNDLDGASHGPVWKPVGVPVLKADPANDPSSEEWDQARQAFKETGLLKRVTSELG